MLSRSARRTTPRPTLIGQSVCCPRLPLTFESGAFAAVGPARNAWSFHPAQDEPWTLAAYQSWRRRAFRRSLSLAHADPSSDPMEQRCPACAAAPGKPCQTPAGRQMKQSHVARQRPRVPGRPYDLRHSFASLLLHEGRSVIYVARQLGHDARLTLSTYGHVIDELDDVPRIDAEAAIAEARAHARRHRATDAGVEGVTTRESYRPRVHIGCIRLQPQIVSSRLTRHKNRPYAAGLATGDDWPLLLRFSDKEEVPGSSPGSPTGDFPANRHLSGGRSTRTGCSTTRRGCIWGAVATSSLHVDGESSSATFNDRAAAGRPCLTDQKSGWYGDEGQHDAGGSG